MYQSIRELARHRLFLLYTIAGSLLILLLGILQMKLSVKDIPFFWLQPHLYEFSLEHPIWSQTLHLSLVLLMGSAYYKLHDYFGISGLRTYLPFFFFVLLFSTLAGMNYFSIDTLTSVLFIPLLFVLFSSFQTEKSSESGFIIGLLLATISMMWTTALYYIPALMVGMWKMRSLTFKSTLAFFLGILTPIWLECAYYFGTDGFASWVSQYPKLIHIDLYAINKEKILSLTPTEMFVIGNGILVSVISIFTSVYLIGKAMLEKVRTQAILQFFVILSFYSIVLLVIDYPNWMGHLTLLNIAQASLLSHYFIRAQNKSGNYLFILLIVVFITSSTYSIWIS